MGLNHRLGLFPKDSGWLVRLPGRRVFVAGVVCRRCPFTLADGLLDCGWGSQLFAAVGVRETGALLSSPALSSELSCLAARLDDGDAGDSDVLDVCFRGAAGDTALEDVADRRGVPALGSS